MILTHEHCEKQPFAGQNTRQTISVQEKGILPCLQLSLSYGICCFENYDYFSSNKWDGGSVVTEGYVHYICFISYVWLVVVGAGFGLG